MYLSAGRFHRSQQQECSAPVRCDDDGGGSDCKVTNVLFVYLGPPSLKDAVDRAVGTRGNALVNQVTYTSTYTFILGNIQCFKVKGDVITLR